MTTKDGGVRGTVIQVPYPTRSDAESAQPPVKKKEGPEASAISLELEDEKAKEAGRKVKRQQFYSLPRYYDVLLSRACTVTTCTCRFC